MTSVTERFLAKWPLPELDDRLGKESRGTVLVVGGCASVPGAVLLAAEAALRVGAGRIQVATVKSAAAALGAAIPESAVFGLKETRSGEIAAGAHRELAKQIAKCDALLLGPGATEARALRPMLRLLLEKNDHAPAVIDAGALNELRGLAKGKRMRLVATPHAGEMATLLDRDRDAILDAAEEAARDAAKELRCVVALKGAETLIAAPDGEVLRHTGGNLGLGTSGSGDVLSGLIAGLCARGAKPMQATAWGVFLHARAGELLAKRVGPLGYLARELAPEVPGLLARMKR